MTYQFNPERLKIARMRRQLTLKSLAEKVGLSPRMVSEYEKDYCVSSPKPETVSAYEKALGYSSKFLMDMNDIEQVEPDSVSFRSLKSMKASNQHAAISAGSLGLLLDNYLDSHFNLPDIDIPDLRGYEPEAAAEMVREIWGLGCHSINNMIHLLEKHGVRVFSLAENTQSVDAFSFWKDEKPYIFLNTQKSGERSRMDAAHELGHLVLHRHGIAQGKDVEHEADRFAYFFLMPRSTVLAVNASNISVDNIISIKAQWKTSAMAVIMQLRSVNLITEWHHRSLIIEASRRGLRKTEINGIERETAKLLDLFIQQLSKDGIKLKGIAEDLALPLEEITNLIFKVGLVTNDQPIVTQPNSVKPKLKLV
jgi:Zn-dependent peptidase ImmA (M78 family)/DNA-binding XRE family transcriptional regulator